MNILQFICPSGFYGAEMWILALAKNLDREKVNCQLAITLESDGQNMELYNRFLSLGLGAHQIRMSGRFDPKVIQKLCQLIKQKEIDVIHTHGYKSDILGVIASKLTGIKAVATPHGFENASNRKLQLFIRLGCIALKYFDKVAPLSEELRADMDRFKVNPKKNQLIVNGVDLDEIEKERKKATSARDANSSVKVIGYVGQIAYRKNVADLIRAFDLFFKKRKDLRLMLVGDGPQRKELEEMAKSLPSGEQIEFLGYRPDRLRLMKEMDLFCMTSSLEGIPRCMMEAMAMEVPVVAYNIPGVNKLIIPEKTGLMAPFGDVEELVQCWKRMLSNGNFGEQMAKNARQHVFEKFSAKRMAEEYTKLYEEMVGRKKAHS